MALPSGLTKQRRELTKFWLNWRIPIVATAAVVVLLVGGNYAWRQISTELAAGRRAEHEAAANRFQNAVSEALERSLGQIRSQVDAAALARALQSGDRDAIRAAEAELEANEDVLRARALGLDVDRPDYDSTPPLSYAALDMMRRTEASGKALAPEVHLIGSEDEHVAMHVRLENAAGALVGHLLLAIELDLLRDATDSVKLAGDYVELRQPVAKSKPVVVASRGNEKLRSRTPTVVGDLPGTRWLVAFWAAGAAEARTRESNPLIWTGGGAVLVLALVGYALVRRRGGAGEQGAVPVAAAGAVAGGGEETVRNRAAKLEQKLSALRAGDAPEAGAAGPGIEVDEGEPPAPARARAGEAGSGAEELPESIFRAYDVRGVVGKTLTPEIVRDIGRAIGSEAEDRGQQTLVVGRDGRKSSPELVQALSEGLLASGRDVIDIGRVPTPVLYFATDYLNTGSGVMVTGSHNPPEYNGLKIMLGADTLFGDSITALRTRVAEGRLQSGSGSRQEMDVVPEYVRRVSEDVPVALGNAYKVVIDCGNGVAGDVAPKMLRALGHDIVELYCEVDGSFPNHHPDPSQPANLKDLIAAVKEHGADLGFAFDGDGDRLGVVDGKGRIIWPDRQMMLFARDVISRNPGAEIVFDVKCTSRLPKVIEKLGGKPVMWKTGHSFIKSKMKETGALLAGEMSGHFFFKERWFGFDDALYAAARMLEILLSLNKPPAEIFSKLPAGVSTPELRVDVEEGAQTGFVERLVSESSFGDASVSTIDGLRVDFADGWGLVRASNTTPSLVLRFEGDDKAALERIAKQFKSAMLSIDPGLKLPF